jgi:hypothetical protein
LYISNVHAFVELEAKVYEVDGARMQGEQFRKKPRGQAQDFLSGICSQVVLFGMLIISCNIDALWLS